MGEVVGIVIYALLILLVLGEILLMTKVRRLNVNLILVGVNQGEVVGIVIYALLILLVLVCTDGQIKLLSWCVSKIVAGTGGFCVAALFLIGVACCRCCRTRRTSPQPATTRQRPTPDNKVQMNVLVIENTNTNSETPTRRAEPQPNRTSAPEELCVLDGLLELSMWMKEEEGFLNLKTVQECQKLHKLEYLHR